MIGTPEPPRGTDLYRRRDVLRLDSTHDQEILAAMTEAGRILAKATMRAYLGSEQLDLWDFEGPDEPVIVTPKGKGDEG